MENAVDNALERSAARVLGVLAGEDFPSSLLRRWGRSADLVLAADRGADLALAAGLRPDLAVGDLDSISDDARAAVKDVRLSPSQDETDCDKLLAAARSRGVEAITLAAVEGDLPDHVLAALHSAARSPLRVRLAFRRGVGWIMKEAEERVLAARPGQRISLIPLAEAAGVSLQGVRWPLEGATLHPRGLTSVSNRATGHAVHVRLGSGLALLFAEYREDEVPFW